MSQYELTLVIDAATGPEKFDAILKSVEDQIKKVGGEISKREPWGKKQLAYPINKVTEGVYHLLHIQFIDSEKIKPFETHLRLREDILRYLVVRKQIKKSAITSRRSSSKGIKSAKSKSGSTPPNRHKDPSIKSTQSRIKS